MQDYSLSEAQCPASWLTLSIPSQSPTALSLPLRYQCQWLLSPYTSWYFSSQHSHLSPELEIQDLFNHRLSLSKQCKMPLTLVEASPQNPFSIHCVIPWMPGEGGLFDVMQQNWPWTGAPVSSGFCYSVAICCLLKWQSNYKIDLGMFVASLGYLRDIRWTTECVSLKFRMRSQKRENML